ncbi:N-acetyltransferase [Pseudolysobacter antarcticus]|uniref:N-acetyltransferase n=1 Tax=Pseudolysobacter antarcticus TaxID=2511995 RepID=A0A411HN55_9GAMM|nr:GNAT family N-acetyltransferase [Pseudolysobacter antarcticus]QBB71908.1 N-acetyltransferase [Pseudolysobacter antarcticus]
MSAQILAHGWADSSAALALRNESAADTVFLEALYASVRAEEMRPVPWPDQAKRDFLQQQFQLQHEHYRRVYIGADFLVVEHEGEPIGRIYVYRTPNEIRLMDIALIERMRGGGIGSSLLDALMQEATIKQIQLALHVEPNNPAQRLYQRLGFSLIEDRGVYHFLGWRTPAPDTSDSS